jgi:hypothetical protein
VSDTQTLTPALSTPGRDLLRREIYQGLADRAAGRVKDLDVDATLGQPVRDRPRRLPLLY